MCGDGWCSLTHPDSSQPDSSQVRLLKPATNHTHTHTHTHTHSCCVLIMSSPLPGYLVDVTGNYGSAFYSCAAGMGLGAVFLALVPTAKTWSPCGTERLEIPEEETPDDGGGGGDEEMNTGSVTSTSSKRSDAGRDEEREHQDVVVELEEKRRGGDEGIGEAETRCV